MIEIAQTHKKWRLCCEGTNVTTPSGNLRYVTAHSMSSNGNISGCRSSSHLADPVWVLEDIIVRQSDRSEMGTSLHEHKAQTSAAISPPPLLTQHNVAP